MIHNYIKFEGIVELDGVSMNYYTQDDIELYIDTRIKEPEINLEASYTSFKLAIFAESNDVKLTLKNPELPIYIFKEDARADKAVSKCKKDGIIRLSVKNSLEIKNSYLPILVNNTRDLKQIFKVEGMVNDSVGVGLYLDNKCDNPIKLNFIDNRSIYAFFYPAHNGTKELSISNSFDKGCYSSNKGVLVVKTNGFKSVEIDKAIFDCSYLVNVVILNTIMDNSILKLNKELSVYKYEDTGDYKGVVYSKAQVATDLIAAGVILPPCEGKDFPANLVAKFINTPNTTYEIADKSSFIKAENGLVCSRINRLTSCKSSILIFKNIDNTPFMLDSFSSICVVTCPNIEFVGHNGYKASKYPDITLHAFNGEVTPDELHLIKASDFNAIKIVRGEDFYLHADNLISIRLPSYLLYKDNFYFKAKSSEGYKGNIEVDMSNLSYKENFKAFIERGNLKLELKDCSFNSFEASFYESASYINVEYKDYKDNIKKPTYICNYSEYFDKVCLQDDTKNIMKKLKPKSLEIN